MLEVLVRSVMSLYEGVKTRVRVDSEFSETMSDSGISSQNVMRYFSARVYELTL